VNENQKSTLWRIKDTEDLLRTRVSDQYVLDAIKTLDEKLSKDIKFADSKQIERLEKTFKETNVRLNQTNIFVTEKMDDIKKSMQQID